MSSEESAAESAFCFIWINRSEIDWPADLPAGIETVVILDDEPNPHHTLRVHPPDDPTRVALVVFDQLALCEDQ